MNEKIMNLYNECINELKQIGIDITNKEIIGTIDINLAKRKTKRYGCCKQDKPDVKTKYIEKIGRRKIIKYERFLEHHIEISKWVMELDDKIIKNTIMHEIIHCFPGCNNHGEEFKRYAGYINQKLGYNISRLGNVKQDYEKSNMEYVQDENYKYKVICKQCGQSFFRKRMAKNFTRNYRCGICRGYLKVELIENR